MPALNALEIVLSPLHPDRKTVQDGRSLRVATLWRGKTYMSPRNYNDLIENGSAVYAEDWHFLNLDSDLLHHRLDDVGQHDVL